MMCERCGATEGMRPSLCLYELCPRCEEALREEHAVWADRARLIHEEGASTMACERCWTTRRTKDVLFCLCPDCESSARRDYANRKIIHDRALNAPIECEALELINAADIASIEVDRRTAEAARAFWASFQWFGMYLDGFRPQNWPEYDQLCRAILRHERPTIAAGRASWRIRLARWLVGL